MSFSPGQLLSALSHDVNLTPFESKSSPGPNQSSSDPILALFQSLSLPDSTNDKEPQIKKYKLPTPATYHSYQSKGISFEFVEASPQKSASNILKLHTIILYNGHQGFLRFSQELPMGLTLDMTNLHLVQKLGEPQGKGGSKQAAIWIEYDVGELIRRNRVKCATEEEKKALLAHRYRIMFEFKKNTWEDLENPIACVYLFESDG